MEHTNGWTFIGIMGSVNGTIHSQTFERWVSWSVSFDWSVNRVGCDWLFSVCWLVECVIKNLLTDGNVLVDWSGDGWGVINPLIRVYWWTECVIFLTDGSVSVDWSVDGWDVIDWLIDMGFVDWWSISFVWWECFSWLISWWLGCDWFIWGLLIDGVCHLMGVFQLIDQLMDGVWLTDWLISVC